MPPEQNPPASRPTSDPAGRPFAAYLLFAGAAGLLLLAATHGAGYAAVILAIRNSGLTPWFQGAVRALWLGYALQLSVIALILATAGWKPGSVSRAVTILCGLLPLPTGLLLANAAGSAFATGAYLVVAVLTLAGALLVPRDVRQPRPQPVPQETAAS
jgi:hypothetical protein